MPPTRASRFDDLRRGQRSLRRASGWVRFALIAAGVSLALDQAKPLLSDAQFTWAERRILGLIAASWIGSFALAGWIVGTLLRAGSDLLEAVADQAEDAARVVDLLETHAVPALGRIALALESARAPAPTPPASAADPRVREAEAARAAIDSERWGRAERLVAAFVRDHPGPEAAALLGRLDDRRRAVVDDLRDRLEEARGRDDVIGAADLRDALTEHLRGDPLHDLDRDLARWAVAAIRRRARAGEDRARLAASAARALDSLGDMPEIEPLRAAFPGVG